jgi:hypothetical protein
VLVRGYPKGGGILLLLLNCLLLLNFTYTV